MYIIHPKKLIYLANPKTGSTSFGMYWLKERFDYGEQERVTRNGLQVIGGGFPSPKWGNHHAMDKGLFDQLKAKGYQSFTVIRNPWDHVVSWFHGSGRADLDFPTFVQDFDEIVHYTLPIEQPGNIQVLTKWADRVARFENLEPDLSEIMGEPVNLGHFNAARKRKHYREYYDDRLKDIVAKRCKDFLLDYPYQY